MIDSLSGKPFRLHSWLVSGIVAWTLAVTSLRALRWLCTYAEGHWLLDYRFGFIKRGLPGTVLSALTDPLGIPLTRSFIEWLSLVPTTIFYGVILLLCWRIVSKVTDREVAICATLAFVSSCFIVMNAHCVGYYDTVIYLLTIAAVALILRGHPLAAAGVQVVALLSHENYVLVGWPIVCLASYFRYRDETGSQRKWYLLGMCTILPVYGVMLMLPYFMDMENLRIQLTDHLRASATLHGEEEFVPIVITRRMGLLFFFHYKTLWQRTFSPKIWLQVGPTLVVLLACCHALFNIRLGSRLSWLILAICAAPLAFHLVATDTMRLTSCILCSAFLVLWILAETQPAIGQARWLAVVALPVVCHNALMRVSLYDFYSDRFSLLMRLVLYTPAIALVAYFVVRGYLRSRANR